MLKRMAYPVEARSIALEYAGPRFTAPHDVRLLIWLARQTEGALLELGCNEGRTLRELARAFPGRRCLGVDWSQAPLCAGQAMERTAPGRIGWHAWELPNVMCFDMASGSFLADSRAAEQEIGFTFVDGDHTWDGVHADTEAVMRHWGVRSAECGVRSAERPKSRIVAWHDVYEGGPGWVEVKRYLEQRPEKIVWVEESWVAYCMLE